MPKDNALCSKDKNSKFVVTKFSKNVFKYIGHSKLAKYYQNKK